MRCTLHLHAKVPTQAIAEHRIVRLHRDECVTLVHCSLLSRDDRLSSASLARLSLSLSSLSSQVNVDMQSTCIRTRLRRQLRKRTLFLCVSYREFRTVVVVIVGRPTVTSGAVIEFSVLVATAIRLASKSKFVSSPARRVIGAHETNDSRSIREQYREENSKLWSTTTRRLTKREKYRNGRSLRGCLVSAGPS